MLICAVTSRERKIRQTSRLKAKLQLPNVFLDTRPEYPPIIWITTELGQNIDVVVRHSPPCDERNGDRLPRSNWSYKIAPLTQCNAMGSFVAGHRTLRFVNSDFSRRVRRICASSVCSSSLARLVCVCVSVFENKHRIRGR